MNLPNIQVDMRRKGIFKEAAQHFYIYFLTDSNRNFIQVNLSTNLVRTMQEHKNSPDLFMNITAPHRLIYFEEYTQRERAFSRIRELLHWTRSQKEKLIRSVNPDWIDISIGLGFEQILEHSFGRRKLMSVQKTA